MRYNQKELMLFLLSLIAGLCGVGGIFTGDFTLINIGVCAVGWWGMLYLQTRGDRPIYLEGYRREDIEELMFRLGMGSPLPSGAYNLTMAMDVSKDKHGEAIYVVRAAMMRKTQ